MGYGGLDVHQASPLPFLDSQSKLLSEAIIKPQSATITAIAQKLRRRV